MTNNFERANWNFEQLSNNDILLNIRSELNSLKSELHSFTIFPEKINTMLSFLDKLSHIDWISEIKDSIENSRMLSEVDIERIDYILRTLSQENIDNLDNTRMSESYDTLSTISEQLTRLERDILDPRVLARQKIENLPQVRGWWFIWNAVKSVLDNIDNKWNQDKSFFWKLKSVFSWVQYKFYMIIIGFTSPVLRDAILEYERISSSQSSLVDGSNLHSSENQIDITEEKIDLFKDQTISKLESDFWIVIDRDAFDRAFNSRRDKYDFNNHIRWRRNEFNLAINWDWNFDTVWNLFGSLWFTSISIFSFINELNKEWVISYKEIWFNIIEQSWNTFIQYGKNSLSLLWNGNSVVFWKLSLEDFTKFVQENFTNLQNLNPENRAAILWILHRHGWLLSQIMKHVWQWLWYLVSLPFHIWEDVSRLSNLSSHLTNNLQKQLDWWNRLSLAFWWWNILDSNLVSRFSQIQDVTKISHALNRANSYDNLINILRNQYWINNLSELSNRLWIQLPADTSDFNFFKRTFWTRIWNWFSIFWDNINDSFTWWQRLAWNVPWIQNTAHEAQKLSTFLKRHWQLTQSYLSNDWVFARLWKYFAQWQRAINSMNMVDIHNSARFYLNSIDDVNWFARDVRYIARRSPELLGHIFWNVPLILMWPELANAISEWDNIRDSSINALKTLSYLFPFVWPFMLFREWAQISQDWFESPALMWTAVVIAWIDTFFFVRWIPSNGIVWSFWRQFAMPFIQLRNFIAATPWIVYDFYKFTWNTITRVSRWWSSALASRSFIPRTRGRAIFLAAVISASIYWLAQARDKFADTDLSEIFDQLSTLEWQDFDKLFLENWWELNQNEKDELLRFTTSLQLNELWFSFQDISHILVENSSIRIYSNIFLSMDDRLFIENELLSRYENIDINNVIIDMKQDFTWLEELIVGIKNSEPDIDIDCFITLLKTTYWYDPTLYSWDLRDRVQQYLDIIIAWVVDKWYFNN